MIPEGLSHPERVTGFTFYGPEIGDLFAAFVSVFDYWLLCISWACFMIPKYVFPRTDSETADIMTRASSTLLEKRLCSPNMVSYSF